MSRQTVAMILGGSLLLALQASASLSAHALSEDARTDSFVCPVTVVNGGKGGIYANDSLAVVLLDKNGFVFAPGGPGFIDRDGALGMKVGWELRKRGTLFVTGRRLGGQAPPARAYISDSYDDYIGGMSLYLVFPTPGCWEITGRIEDGSLTFVTLVEKIRDGPSWRFEGVDRGWRVTQ